MIRNEEVASQKLYNLYALSTINIYTVIHISSCDCKSGYQLADDYFTCIDIDECDIGVSNLCDVHATCTNLNGSHVCTCVEGNF